MSPAESSSDAPKSSSSDDMFDFAQQIHTIRQQAQETLARTNTRIGRSQRAVAQSNASVSLSASLGADD